MFNFRKKADMPHDGHLHHLCYLVNMRFQEKNLKQYMELVCDSKYVCAHCGRTACEKESLCSPVKLEI
jgi:hypothetical protein